MYPWWRTKLLYKTGLKRIKIDLQIRILSIFQFVCLLSPRLPRCLHRPQNVPSEICPLCGMVNHPQTVWSTWCLSDWSDCCCCSSLRLWLPRGLQQLTVRKKVNNERFMIASRILANNYNRVSSCHVLISQTYNKKERC